MKYKNSLLVLMVAGLAAMSLVGCPSETPNDLNGNSWRYEPLGTIVVDGSSSTIFYILTFNEDGTVTEVSGVRVVTADGTVEARGWIKGTYTMIDGTLSMSFADSACEDIGARIDVTGTLEVDDPEAVFLPMVEMPINMIRSTEQSHTYTMDESALTMDLQAATPSVWNRYQDNFDYSTSTWDTCAEEQ